eukprot:CAMPEP_0183311238 /NCGR_PEP_ID=MMETSP0160_2-20130417/35847_1 /TAXON_ID=2839 ORGANISM="Odontella Sinensis, Strain Grunow 1884" /NCGR_SAMPLE_ID=MMETSP0160_2 /ASSEMBLY_ACC=CAM_ASM_000250 /LENGTH=73 /DNA_ID=CAMNT_0025475749 /DNA_START=585 /DNA_END=806 /DNA_ORIENTATION=+
MAKPMDKYCRDIIYHHSIDSICTRRVLEKAAHGTDQGGSSDVKIEAGIMRIPVRDIFIGNAESLRFPQWVEEA